MKVFKKVLFLSLAILALSSSVAFGDCQIEKSSDASVGQTKTLASQQSNQGGNSGHTQAGALGQGAGVGNGN